MIRESCNEPVPSLADCGVRKFEHRSDLRKRLSPLIMKLKNPLVDLVRFFAYCVGRDFYQSLEHVRFFDPVDERRFVARVY